MYACDNDANVFEFMLYIGILNGVVRQKLS